MCASDFALDIRPHFRYKRGRISLIEGRLSRRYSGKRSECGARGREDTARSPGGLGIILPALRPVREVLHWTGTGFSARVTPVEKRKVSAPRLGRPYRTERSGQVPGSMA